VTAAGALHPLVPHALSAQPRVSGKTVQGEDREYALLAKEWGHHSL